MALTLEAIRLIDAIARCGSFAAAAAELKRVPSAVTHAVQRLEQEFGTALFDRAGYRARLTPTGFELLRDGRQLLAAADDLARRVRRIGEGWEPEFRIALDAIVPFASLAPLIERFCASAPTRLRIFHEVLGGTWEAVVTGRAELAIGAVHDGPAGPLVADACRSVEIGRVEFVLAVAPAHPLAAQPQPVPLADLRGHRQVIVGDTSQRLPARAAGLMGLQNELVVPTMEAKIAALIAGLGVGYLPAHLARSALARGELLAITTEHDRRDEGRNGVHVAWSAAARGPALDWWLRELAAPASRAQLLA